jgi:hypothetical protein
MPQMPAVGPNGFSDNLPSIVNHQSMSARTSRSNSLIRPGTGVEDHRRSMTSLEFANNRMNFNNYPPEAAPSDYITQQTQNASTVAGAGNQYNYEHSAAGNNGMSQNGLPVKTEGADTAPYGAPPMQNVDGMSHGQDGTLWRNGTFNNGDPNLLNSSTAGRPYQPKAAGVLTGSF